jgi:hypothetical protein
VFAGCLGVYLDTDGNDGVDRDEIAGIIEEARCGSGCSASRTTFASITSVPLLGAAWP